MGLHKGGWAGGNRQFRGVLSVTICYMLFGHCLLCAGNREISGSKKGLGEESQDKYSVGCILWTLDTRLDQSLRDYLWITTLNTFKLQRHSCDEPSIESFIPLDAPDKCGVKLEGYPEKMTYGIVPFPSTVRQECHYSARFCLCTHSQVNGLL